LDESGLRELVNLLDETPGQKLVISHNNFLKDYFNDRIVVEMTNEISTIRQEAA
jgi:DNA repair exonuclease SbcCD ATPase subunit